MRAACVLVVVAVVGCHKPPGAPIEANGPATLSERNGRADATLAKRGEYIAAIAGCAYCHMGVGANGPDFARPFAGGLEVREQRGTWHAPNITQDREGGIGGWSDDEIIAAIREGVRPDGTQLFAAMPYANFNRMTDDDVRALVAFLRTVPPVDHAVAPNDIALPQRRPPPIARIDRVDDPVAHGEYLVTIMNCSTCHTPLTDDGTPDLAREFAGGVEIEIPALGTGTLYASNITSDPTTGIGAWTDAQMTHGIEKPGVGGTRISGYLAAWSARASAPLSCTPGIPLSDRDRTAIGAYLRTIAPIRNEVPRSTFRVTGWRPGNAFIVARR